MPIEKSGFNYTPDLGSSIDTNQSYNDDRYYLFGQMQFLDAPGEWYYDGTNKLYFMTPDGTSPTNGVLEIKTRSVGFTADKTCSYLTVQGVGFIGTAFQFGSGNLSRSTNIVFSNNTVTYSSYTDYLNVNAGTNGYIQDTLFPAIYADQSQVVNNTFAYGALSSLLIEGLSNNIENNLIHDFDYSSSLINPMLQVNLAWASVVGYAGNSVVRYNSLYRSGGVGLLVEQGTNDVYLNNVNQCFISCYGGNKDSAAIYTQNTYCTGSRIHHNWAQNSYSGTPPQSWGAGLGIRGDDLTCGLTVDHNVSWNIGGGGIDIKNTNNPTTNQANQCINNTVFNDSLYNASSSAIIIKCTLPNENSNSIVANNLAHAIVGDWSVNSVPLGHVRLNASNTINATPAALLVNASTNTNSTSTWLDFRPATNATSLIAKGSTNVLIKTNLPGIASVTSWPIINTNGSGKPDVGAYQRGDSIYWIPGQRLSQASFPIVPNGQTNVPAKLDALMWMPAYGATSHTCYISSLQADVIAGTTNALRGTFSGEANVCTNLPALASSTTYYWRVDAVVNGSVVTGNIWSFQTQ